MRVRCSYTELWLSKFSLNKFGERFKIREIREIKDPRNINAIRYITTYRMVLIFRGSNFSQIAGGFLKFC